MSRRLAKFKRPWEKGVHSFVFSLPFRPGNAQKNNTPTFIASSIEGALRRADMALFFRVKMGAPVLLVLSVGLLARGSGPWNAAVPPCDRLEYQRETGLPTIYARDEFIWREIVHFLLEEDRGMDASDVIRIGVAEKTRAHPLFGRGSPMGYVVNGREGATIRMKRGQTHRFSVDAIGHPFYFTRDPIGGRATDENLTLEAIDAVRTTFEFEAIGALPASFYYQCHVHPSMGGRVQIVP